MNVVLIPGMWLNASAWDEVIAHLEGTGHRVTALTLPGMDSASADRSRVSRQDHIDAVLAAIDAADPGDGPVGLVGHSAAGGLAHAAVDARPERVARVVYVGGEPRGDDDGEEGPFPAENGEIPFPGWSAFDDEMVADLDDELRARLSPQMIPWPERVNADCQRLSDDRRYDVPVTMVCCEFPSNVYAEWAAQGEPGLAELTRIRSVDWVDLNCGHWPMYTRPADLARVILDSID